MEYVSEMSEPRYRKMVWYCAICSQRTGRGVFRITYEPDQDNLFIMLLDGIDFSNILPPHIQRRLSEKTGDLVSPFDTRRSIIKTSS
jgi:hypothetical protein